MYTPLPVDVAEATADFTKSQSLIDKEFLKAQKALKRADDANLKKAFIVYCTELIKLKKNGVLTVREACYIINGCEEKVASGDDEVQRIIFEAGVLQRHPSNYKASHEEGWAVFVDQVAAAK